MAAAAWPNEENYGLEGTPEQASGFTCVGILTTAA
jgi:hypothetical protein